ncbi:MAG: ABC transporter substrate-binding protein [Methylocystis sp.]|nr:ABC transporter substrate-binding protein [Methylocystis sp.]MCA3582513.1 ABC transporter substrate-binding protein [Methylocystis sp.]MCA3588797.1 ABC transporter substrate-binding protein [Methylocystis sp.]MCA3592871.1 ABC transporter substrate-binding protein [Methylocystis sp.]
MTILRRIFLTGLLVAFSFALPQPTAQAQTIEITDVLGRKVTVKSPVERVVLTFYFEEFTAIAGVDAWKKVVGISRTPWEGWRPAIFSRYAPLIPNLAGMPDVGFAEDNSFSAEKTIALRPDVVFMAEWAFKAQSTAREQLAAAGIPVVVIDYNAQKLENHLASTRVIGKVMGAEARAEEIALLYEREHKDVLRRIAAAGGARPKVYVELGQAGPETIGNTYNNTMWGNVITTVGGENIATGKIPGPWGPLAAEAVIAANPDVIFIAGSSWLNRPKAVKTGYDMTPDTTRATLRPYAERPGWSELSAVKAGRVYALEHGLGRSLADFAAMQFIAKQLYPAAFADVDPEASLKAFHATYLPVPFSGAWMVPLKP